MAGERLPFTDFVSSAARAMEGRAEPTMSASASPCLASVRIALGQRGRTNDFFDPINLLLIVSVFQFPRATGCGRRKRARLRCEKTSQRNHVAVCEGVGT